MDKSIVVAKELLTELEEELEWNDYTILKSYKGKELEYVVTQHPLYDRESPLILGEHVHWIQERAVSTRTRTWGG